MRLKIFGKSPNISNKEVRYACNFFAEQLMSKRLANRLHLEIKFDPTMMQDYAEIGPHENYWESPYRRFQMSIDPTCIKWLLLTTFAHEFYHIKQYATGQRHDLLNDKIRFNKKYYHADQIKYDECPWEIEAYSGERPLYRLYRDHVKANKLVF